ncbi:DUF397 domain-containing protein [Actinophytocola oryzae]|uniref:Uncharacterized protein DUF397 n=1 Tax=Actinophytocola oryzae TaxID=502181 RepID=A0A4V3FU83_9PSEU|nr:DUF397 domain-containing protein [Actinophytocola oryzae]TDV54211.1 uncharacterized protein DUF397 [Actinophytocola oryzae]
MGSYEPVVFTNVFPARGWRAAGRCGPNGGNCVEVNLDVLGLVGLRDSKSSTGRVIVLDGGGWFPFLDATKSGRFDLE